MSPVAEMNVGVENLKKKDKVNGEIGTKEQKNEVF
jgi:hypothetical protein